MKTNQLPLTETIFYLLLAFLEPSYGYIAITKIEEMSNGEVRIAAGTMYGAIENLLKVGMIEQMNSDNERRKVYQTTTYGREILKLDTARLRHRVELWKQTNKEV